MSIILGFLAFILGAIGGGIIQIVVTILFEATARRYYRRFRRLWMLINGSLRDISGGMEREHFRVGNFRTHVVILEGSPTSPYLPESVSCHLENDHLKLPTELQLLRDEVEREQNDIERRKGNRDFHNGAMVAFSDYNHSYTHMLEEPTLFLKFRLTDYYTFLATTMKLSEVAPGSSNPSDTIRALYFDNKGTLRHPDINFATSFGVNIAFVTKDNYLVIARRSESGVSHYHGLYTVPIMESVNPLKDRDRMNQLDVYQTVIRGASEEMGISIGKGEIKIFTLAVDAYMYLYGLTGLVMSDQVSRDDLVATASRGVRDRWEAQGVSYVPFEPEEVARYIREVGGATHFHPTSFVSIIQSLIYYFDQPKTTKAFR